MKFKTDSKDHRKRPRNRTTQSCLNCHSSKRLCDRKRPSCGRCVKMGLSGSCTYEVDDPRQRNGCEDTIEHLRRRITELERFIRTCKQRSPLNSCSIRRASLPPPELSRESFGVEGCDMPSPLSDSVVDQATMSIASCDSIQLASFNFLSHMSDEIFYQNTAEKGDKNPFLSDKLSSSSSSLINNRNDPCLFNPSVVRSPKEYCDIPLGTLSETPSSTSGITTPFPSGSTFQVPKYHCACNDATYPLDDVLDNILQIRSGSDYVNAPAPVCSCHHNVLILEIMEDLYMKVKKSQNVLSLLPEHYYHHYLSTSKEGCEHMTAINDVLTILSRTLNTGYRYANTDCSAKDLNPSRYNGIDSDLNMSGLTSTSTPDSWFAPSDSSSPMNFCSGLRAQAEFEFPLARSSSRSQLSQPRTWDHGGFSGIAQHAPFGDGGLMSWNGLCLDWP